MIVQLMTKLLGLETGDQQDREIAALHHRFRSEVIGARRMSKKIAARTDLMEEIFRAPGAAKDERH